MAKYKVLRPIEHNQKLYLPKTQHAPERVKSYGHGQEIAVDGGGFIELGDKEAALLQSGEIERVTKTESGVSGQGPTPAR